MTGLVFAMDIEDGSVSVCGLGVRWILKDGKCVRFGMIDVYKKQVRTLNICSAIGEDQVPFFFDELSGS
jgi:hypothetical protein